MIFISVISATLIILLLCCVQCGLVPVSSSSSKASSLEVLLISANSSAADSSSTKIHASRVEAAIFPEVICIGVHSAYVHFFNVHSVIEKKAYPFLVSVSQTSMLENQKQLWNHFLQ